MYSDLNLKQACLSRLRVPWKAAENNLAIFPALPDGVSCRGRLSLWCRRHWARDPTGVCDCVCAGWDRYWRDWKTVIGRAQWAEGRQGSAEADVGGRGERGVRLLTESPVGFSKHCLLSFHLLKLGTKSRFDASDRTLKRRMKISRDNNMKHVKTHGWRKDSCWSVQHGCSMSWLREILVDSSSPGQRAQRCPQP